MDRVAAIRERIENSLAPQSIDIIDESHLHIGHAGAASGGGHFAVTIVSEIFIDKPTLARHRLVYQALADMMPAEIHALSISALTPEEQP